MPTFFYRGKGPKGDIQTGTILAENQRAALRALEGMKVYPMEIDQRSESDGSETVTRFKVRADDITLFARQLGDLLRVGVPITRAFETLLKETRREEFRLLLSEIASHVTGGKSLADSLAFYPRLFPELFVSMIRAGEEGGFLAEVLGKIADHRERQKELKGRVRAALIYPALL
ncbi:MAG: type II secretion system F family protein, partial [Planctomycetota bacterium]|nr:type II secretion system F family protein [Planctomycetota bacterium]